MRFYYGSRQSASLLAILVYGLTLSVASGAATSCSGRAPQGTPQHIVDAKWSSEIGDRGDALQGAKTDIVDGRAKREETGLSDPAVAEAGTDDSLPDSSRFCDTVTVAIDVLESCAALDIYQSDDVECQLCLPDCTGKECGQDGCGGICGSCDGNYCFPGDWRCGKAELGNCELECGWQGMAPCGECPGGFQCDNLGLCESVQGGCWGIPPNGFCINGTKVTCLGGEAVHEYCPFGECHMDGDIPVCENFECLAKCFGRTCGDDSCGGSCGACASGDVCDQEHGICLPQGGGCGGISEGGICIGQVLVSCLGGLLSFEPCLPQGKVCVDGPCIDSPSCRFVWPGTECHDLPPWGQCAADHLFYCESGEMKVKHCYWEQGISCNRIGLTSYGCSPWG